MTEIKEALERIERRVAMPEPAMEHLLRRRERKQRNERIAAAAVGLGVTALGVVGAVLTLRAAGGTTPASGGRGAAGAAEGGGFVLPTVAIWTAIVVLGLTAFAVVRLRAHLNVDVEREGREPGGAAASARRQAAAPGDAPWKGGSEMDSKPKTDVGIPGVEMPEIRFDDGKLRRTNRWLVGAVVVLAVALVAVGTWAIVHRSGEGQTAAGPTADPRTEVIDAVSAAWNGADSSAMEDLYAENAVLTTKGGVYEGRDTIIGLKESAALQLTRVSGVIGQRKYVAAVMRLENINGHAYVLTLWKFNADGKIVSQQGFYGGS